MYIPSTAASRTILAFGFALLATAGIALAHLLEDPLPARAPSDWPMAGGNHSATRYSPLGMIDRENVTRLDIVWTQNINDSLEWAPPGSPPLVRDGRLYVTGGSGSIYAFAADTGEMQWRHDEEDAPAPPVFLPPDSWGWRGTVIHHDHDLVYTTTAAGSMLRWMPTKAMWSGVNRSIAGSTSGKPDKTRCRSSGWPRRWWPANR